MAEIATDVLVAGGGPAGLALALTLRRYSSLAVTVIERTAYDEPRIGETLSPGAQGLLEYLGVWDGFVADAHLPAPGTAAAWGSADLVFRDFMLTPFGSGWHLDRRRFDARLAMLAEAAGAAVWRRSRVESCEREPSGWRVEVINSSRRPVNARFLVDATGRTGALARRLGGVRHRLDRQVAVAGTFALEPGKVTDALTLVEACEAGWWYSARLPDQQMVVALVSDADLVARCGLAERVAWSDLLATTTHTSRRVGNASVTAPPRTVASHSASLDRVFGDGWLAAGDAAACHDPLSSSGIVRALDSGIHAARALHTLLVSGRSEGLDEYDRRMSQAYAQYCDTRARYYELEQRWPDASFWQRRQRLVRLHPRSSITRARAQMGAVLRLPADLRHVDAGLLWVLAEVPRAAYELVAGYRSRSGNNVSDQEIILAIQWLAANGAFHATAPH